MRANYQYVDVVVDDTTVILTINRPDKLNALNSDVISELSDAVSNANAACLKSSGVRAGILTGAGTKAFVAGADIAEISVMSIQEAKALSARGHNLGRLVEEGPLPWVAAVNGFALGGGCELALCCDFMIASVSAKFGLPEARLGLIPGFGGTQRLARRVGLAHARELIYTGKTISADTAATIGLVNRVVLATELLNDAKATAQSIAAAAPLAVSAVKRVMLRGQDTSLQVANELETATFASMLGTEDAQEGTRAFVEKRPPRFSGR